MLTVQEQTEVTADSVHAKMMAIVNEPGYPYLQGYRKDLEELDLAYLRHNWDPQGRYLWVIKPLGSELIRLGVHSKQNEYAAAVLSQARREAAAGCDIFVLQNGKLKRIDADKAKIELLQMDYIVDGSAVQLKSGEILATFEVQKKQVLGNLGGSVCFGTAYGMRVTAGQRVALRHIATGEMVKAWGSLFARVDEVLLDGEPLFKD